MGPIYIFDEGEMLLDAPVYAVWPHVINYASWQNYSVVKHVSGVEGREGEVVLLKKEEIRDSPPYLARTIKLEHERRIIWKTFSEESSDFGIVEFSVDAVREETRFSYKLLYEIAVACESEAELAAIRSQRVADVKALLATVLPKLRARVEVAKI